MVVIDSDDLFRTSRDSDEFLVHGSGSSLPSSTSSVSGRGLDSLVDLLVSTNGPDITISDIAYGNIEEGLWTEILPSIS